MINIKNYFIFFSIITHYNLHTCLFTSYDSFYDEFMFTSIPQEKDKIPTQDYEMIYIDMEFMKFSKSRFILYYIIAFFYFLLPVPIILTYLAGDKYHLCNYFNLHNHIFHQFFNITYTLQLTGRIGEAINDEKLLIFFQFTIIILQLLVVPIIIYTLINQFIKTKSLLKSWYIYMLFMLIYVLITHRCWTWWDFESCFPESEKETINTLDKIKKYIIIEREYNQINKNKTEKITKEIDFKLYIIRVRSWVNFINIFKIWECKGYSKDSLKIIKSINEEDMSNLNNINNIEIDLVSWENYEYILEYNSPFTTGMKGVLCTFIINNIILITSYYMLKGYYHLRPIKYKEKRDYINTLNNNLNTPINVLDNNLDTPANVLDNNLIVENNII